MRKILLLSLFGIFLLSGCLPFQKKNTYTSVHDYKIYQELTQVSKIIQKNTQEIDKSSKDIDEKIDSINKEVEKIEENNPDETKETNLNRIKEHAKGISEDNEKIKNASKEISGSSMILDTIESKVKDTNKDLNKIAQERDKALEKLDKSNIQTRKTLQWLIFASILGVGGSVALIVMGNAKFGIAGAIGSIAVLVLAITISQHIMLIAWGGLCIIVLIVLFILYEAYVQRVANKELVETAELAKVNMDENSRAKVFGEGKEKGLAGEIQSKSTSNIVKREKTKLNGLWKYSKERLKKGNPNN